MARRRRVVIVATSALLVLAAGITVPLRSAATWRAFEAAAGELRTEVATAPATRNVLWGEPGPGNAHEHYALAVEFARALCRDHHEALVELLPHGEAWTADREHLRARWREALVHLRAGAAATDVARPLPDLAGPAPAFANLLDVRWLVNFAVFEARALRHEGRHLEAVRCTLDAATLAADVARAGTLIDQMIGGAALAIATKEAWPDVALAELDGAALAALADGLAKLDANLPLTLDDRTDLLAQAWYLHNMPSDAEWQPSSAALWQYGFSRRWVAADAFLQQLERSRQLAPTAGAAWPERTAVLARASEAALASGNPLVANFLPGLATSEGGWRTAVAQVRLLRLAVDLHRGLEPAPLADPIGNGPIAVTRRENGVELACQPILAAKQTTRLVAR